MATKQRDIDERTFQFAVRSLKMVNAMPKSASGMVVSRQIVRSATGVGANVTEAQGTSTKKEFARKMNIARGEAREALYWLRLIAASGMLPESRLSKLIQEGNELVSILTAIVKRART
ncbi:MAG: four helix bundle protein [Planctomycetes bacterium]|nr:four helix bundle protein [Planctomycetota bacterium]MBI3833020.1 four helix bundle protein [Planctomycetota bacterium]